MAESFHNDIIGQDFLYFHVLDNPAAPHLLIQINVSNLN